MEFENKMSKNVDSHQKNFLALSPFFLKIFPSLVARVSQVVSKLEQHIFFYDSHTQTGRTYWRHNAGWEKEKERENDDEDDDDEDDETE